MRGVVCCALLCAVVAYVQSSQQSQSPGFDEEQTYTYSVQGHVVTGVGNSQHDGMQLGYQIQVTRINQDTLHLKPKNFKSLRNCETQCQENRNQQISADILQYLQSPIEITVRKGKVAVLQLQAGMPVWAVNMKKSQSAPFTLNNDAPSQNTADNKEKTVYGQCNVQYRVIENDEDNQLQQQQQQQQQNGNNQNQNNSQQNRNQFSKQQKQPQQQYQQQSQEFQESQRQQKYAAKNNQQDANQMSQDQNDSNDSSDSSESQEDNNNYVKKGLFGRLANYLPYGSASSSENDQEEDEEQTVKKFCGNNQSFQIIQKYTVDQCENTPFPSNNNTESALAQQMNNLQNRVVITRYLACGPSRRNYDIIRIDREEQSQNRNGQNGQNGQSGQNGQNGQSNGNNNQNQGLVQAVQKYVLTDISSASVRKLERPKNLSFFVNVAYNFNAKPLQPFQQPYGNQPELQQQLKQAQQQNTQNQQQGWQRQQAGGQYNQQQQESQQYNRAGQIVVYMDTNFGGTHTIFDVQPRQCYNVPKGWNDVISSIDAGQYCFILYEHKGCTDGQAIRLERYSYGSQKLELVGMNDKVSSLQMC